MTTIEALAEVARKYGVAVGLPTLTAGAGFLAGYYFAKHRLEEKIQETADEKLEEQIEATRKHFTVIREDEKPATPADAVEQMIPEAAEALRSYVDSDIQATMAMYQGKHGEEAGEEEGDFIPQRARYFREEEKPSVVIPVERRNSIWKDDAVADTGESVDFDYDEEMAARTEFEPYIISADEFGENPKEYKQIQLTYFAGDQILIDDEDTIVTNPDAWIGPETNLRFGHRSNDNNLVYIRNPVADYDFVIALSQGSYGAEVAGFDQEVGKQ